MSFLCGEERERVKEGDREREGGECKKMTKRMSQVARIPESHCAYE